MITNNYIRNITINYTKYFHSMIIINYNYNLLKIISFNDLQLITFNDLQLITVTFEYNYIQCLN